MVRSLRHNFFQKRVQITKSRPFWRLLIGWLRFFWRLRIVKVNIQWLKPAVIIAIGLT